jgi:hypothetical protein
LTESAIETALASTTAFAVGNYTFNTDQTVGSGQDNYVLTYDDVSGEIGLEAASGSVTEAAIESALASTTAFTVNNYVFNVDQTVGAGTDNYVLTYDNGSGEIGLEAASGGGEATGVQQSATASSSSGALTLNCSADSVFEVTLTEDIATITCSNVPSTSNIVFEVIIKFKQDSTGGWDVNGWPGTTQYWPNNTAPTMTQQASEGTDIVRLRTWDGGTSWYGDYTNNYQSIAVAVPSGAGLDLRASTYGGSGATWSDGTANGNDATWDGGATELASIYTGGATPYFDLGATANDTLRHFSVSDDTTINPDSSTAFSVAVLCTADDVTTQTQDYLLAKTNEWAIIYNYYDAGRYSLFANSTGSYNDGLDDFFINSTSAWYLVVARCNPGGDHNGAIFGTSNSSQFTAAGTNSYPSSGIVTSTNPWYIGGSGGNTSTTYSGKIAAVWMWKKVLTDNEMLGLAKFVEQDMGYTLGTSFK